MTEIETDKPYFNTFEQSKDNSGKPTRSDIHYSGFGQIPHERDLAIFPTGTYKPQGL